VEVPGFFVDVRSFWQEETTISKSRHPYPPEFRCQLIELARAARNPKEQAKEFEPTTQTIRNWVTQAGLAEGGTSVSRKPPG
jgi:transposase-like protein